MPEERLTVVTQINSSQGPDDKSAESRNSLAHIKRLLERWTADPNFRKSLTENPVDILLKYNIVVDYDVIEPLLKEGYFGRRNGPVEDVSPTLQRYIDYIRRKFTHRDLVRMRAPQLPRLKAWRERQIARGEKQFGSFQNQSLVHATFAIELSRGCSVGCWFCAVSAPKLTDLFLYDPQNAKVWRETLEVLKEICGTTSYGFCYWATDPLDNPDYEKFLLGFGEIFGYLPQTTTALPLKDAARTRSLLKLAKEHGGIHNRFSVLTLSMLNRIHQEFDAEELISVECIPLNNESQRPKANAGRFRDYSSKHPSSYAAELIKLGRDQRSGISEQKEYLPSTIACVSGFLINMIDSTVKLISPCPADDQWPLGYIIFDEKTFRDPADFADVLQKMIADHMPDTLSEQDVVTLRPGQDYTAANGDASNSAMARYFHALDDLVKTGAHTAGKIALLLFYQYGILPETTMEYLNSFLQKGVIESPKAAC